MEPRFALERTLLLLGRKVFVMIHPLRQVLPVILTSADRGKVWSGTARTLTQSDSRCQHQEDNGT